MEIKNESIVVTLLKFKIAMQMDEVTIWLQGEVSPIRKLHLSPKVLKSIGAGRVVKTGVNQYS